MTVEALFRPFICRGLHLANRIALAPAALWACPDGDPAPLAEFYRARVEGGASLVMTEGAVIGRPASYNDPRNARFFGTALESWKGVVDAVHEAGGAIVPQLWHAGSVEKKASSWRPPAEPESPSGLIARNRPRGHALTERDLDDLLTAYVTAARAAAAMKMDAVEVHAAHGYLLDQFFWSETNIRDDRWGGATLPERARFPLEVVKAVRAAAYDSQPVIMRISNWKSADMNARMFASPEELAAWLEPFARAGVDIFSVSDMRYDRPLFDGSALGFAGWVRKLIGLPVIAAGGIGMSGDIMTSFGGEIGVPQPVDDVARRIEAGEFDIVAVGRALIADPEWPHKIEQGRNDELVPCTPQHIAPVLPLP
jgi:2,4-dienoyl-CoA reductase-like NADH-dependent reductase (Old Yellow Enzyme family)